MANTTVNFPVEKKSKIPSSFFQTYNEETGLINSEKVDYKLPNEMYNNMELKMYKMANIPFGTASFCMFHKNEHIYVYGGQNHHYNGPHMFQEISKKDGRNGEFNKQMAKYDIKNNTWKNLGKLKDIPATRGACHFTYNNKFYLFGGYSFEFLDKAYLKAYEKKYGKWPEKKGEFYSNDFYEINVDDNDNDKITINRIDLNMFSNIDMACILIKDKVYFTGGAYGAYQLNTMPIKLLKTYIKDKTWYPTLDKLGDKIYSGSLLFYIDMKDISAGIQIESFFPGIPCITYQMMENNDELYLLCGRTYRNSSFSKHRPNEKNRTSCSDGWKYNLETKEWLRLANYPLNNGSGQRCHKLNDELAIVYCLGGSSFLKMSIDNMKQLNDYNDKNNCRLTVDNYSKYISKIPEEKVKYEKTEDDTYKIIGNDMSPYFKYGTCSNTYSMYNEIEQKTVISLETIKSYDFFQHYSSDVIFFYNFKEDKYYISPYKMPYNTGGTTTNCHLTQNGDLYIFGGEINDILFNDKFHMINTDLVIKIEFGK